MAPRLSGIELVGFLIVPTFAALLVRAIPVLQASFPLNDGALFVTMAEQVSANGYLLPDDVSYNGIDIPFAYPPIGLYLAALASDVLGIRLIEVAHYLPLAFALLTVPIVALICLETLGRGLPAAAATLGYAMAPRAWEWLVGGGGITRSVGVFLAMLAVLVVMRYRNQTSVGSGALVGALAALAALTHPQVAVFVFVTLTVFWFPMAFRRSNQRVALSTIAVGVVSITPWFVIVTTRHGIQPLISAVSSGDGLNLAIANFLSFGFTGAPLVDIFLVLAITGLILSLAARNFIIPAWAALLMIVDGRAAGQYALLPISMLMGIAVEELADHVRRGWTADRGSRAVKVLLVALLTLAILGGLSAPLRNGSPLASLPVDDRVSMEWLRGTDYESAAVVSGERWQVDEASEWFPLLSGIESVATVQGKEWLGADEWDRAVEGHRTLQLCADQALDCLERWMDEHGHPDVVYISGQPRSQIPGSSACCRAVVESIESDSRYEAIYAVGDIRVFATP